MMANWNPWQTSMLRREIDNVFNETDSRREACFPHGVSAWQSRPALPVDQPLCECKEGAVCRSPGSGVEDETLNVSVVRARASQGRNGAWLGTCNRKRSIVVNGPQASSCGILSCPLQWTRTTSS